jgi:hypothetical protein
MGMESSVLVIHSYGWSFVFDSKNMDESPVSPKLKAKKNKYKSFERKFWKSLQYEICIIGFIWSTMGQGVVWYTGQFTQ